MTTTETPEDPVTDDIFLGGRLRILQPRQALRSGLDAVMLAASVGGAPGEAVLDAGAGVGVVGLAVARRCEGVRVTLLEREPDLAALAMLNATRNDLRERTHVVCADLTQPLDRLRAHGLAAGSFDHVLANPPFYDAEQVRASPRALKASATVLAAGDLDRWLRFLAAMAKPGGRLSMIHRADALHEILQAIGNRFGAVTVYPLFPRADTAASRLLVQGIKSHRGPLRILPGLILHEETGGYTARADAILRGGGALG